MKRMCLFLILLSFLTGCGQISDDVVVRADAVAGVGTAENDSGENVAGQTKDSQTESDPEETVMQPNQLFISLPMNEENGPGYYNVSEAPEISPDVFFVAGDRLFLNDPLNDRILVYEGSDPARVISVPEYGLNIVGMFYDEQEDVLRVLYNDWGGEVQPWYHLTNIAGEDTEMSREGRELHSPGKNFSDFCFDLEGNLLVEHAYDKPGDTDLSEVNELPERNAREVMNVLTFGPDGERYYMYNLYCYGAEEDGADSRRRVCIIREKDGVPVSYMIPEMHDCSLTVRHIQVSPNGKVYQMTVDETGVDIWQLGERSYSLYSEEDLLKRPY